MIYGYVWCCFSTTDLVYGLGVMGSEDEDSSVVPLAATVVPGSGRLHVLVNCDAIWEEGVKVAVVCVRRLRQRLGMRDLWGKGLDLYLGEER